MPNNPYFYLLILDTALIAMLLLMLDANRRTDRRLAGLARRVKRLRQVHSPSVNEAKLAVEKAKATEPTIPVYVDDGDGNVSFWDNVKPSNISLPTGTLTVSKAADGTAHTPDGVTVPSIHSPQSPLVVNGPSTDKRHKKRRRR